MSEFEIVSAYTRAHYPEFDLYLKLSLEVTGDIAHDEDIVVYIMDAPLKELSRLEKLTSNSSSKGKSSSIDDSLESLLYFLREVKDRIYAGSASEETLLLLANTVELKKKEVDERQKEVYNALAKLGKALDKVSRSSVTQHNE